MTTCSLRDATVHLHDKMNCITPMYLQEVILTNLLSEQEDLHAAHQHPMTFLRDFPSA